MILQNTHPAAKHATTTEVTLGQIGEATQKQADVVIDPPPLPSSSGGADVVIGNEPSASNEISTMGQNTSVLPSSLPLSSPPPPNFVDVEEIELPTLRWTEWWPTAARKVVFAIHADKKTRKRAVESLLHGIDTFKQTDATPLTTESHAMRVVYASEAKRIRRLEDWMKTMTEAWCSAIRECVSRCDDEMGRKEERKRRIEEKAAKLEEETSSLLFRGRILTDQQKKDCLSVIEDEREVALSLLEKDLLLSLKGIRMEVASGVTLPPPPCMESLLLSRTKQSKAESNKEEKDNVCSALSSLTPFEREYVKKLVASQIQNIEHDCAKRVSVQCETEWMRSLR